MTAPAATDAEAAIDSPPASPEFDAAVAALDGELSVVAADAARVDAACEEIRRRRVCWNDPAPARQLRSLASRAKVGSGVARAPAIALLHDVADAAEDPWPILLELVGAADPDVCRATLAHIRTRALDSRLQADAAHLAALARLIESGPGLLRSTEAIETAGVLVRNAYGDERGATAIYLGSAAPCLRRLAARILDLAPSLPAPEIAERMLGGALASFVEPYLAYTRATHLDLLDLAGGVGAPALLAAFERAEESCGETLLRELVSGIGWRALNYGLDVQPAIGMSVGGSFPLILTRPEAALLETCPGVRKVFDRFVAVAYGGTAVEQAETPDRDAISRFRAYNVRHADLLVELLDVVPLTAPKVRRMVEQMDLLVADFQALFANHAEEVSAVGAAYACLKDRIERELDSSSAADRPLSAVVTRLVQMFEDPTSPSEIHTLHGCKRYLHQRGLRLGFQLAEGSGTTNRVVTVAITEDQRVLRIDRPIEYVDFEATTARPPYVVRLAVKVLSRHMVRCEERLPHLKVFCYGNEIHGYVGFRNHPAFVRLDLSPPHRGGMIDLEYCGVSKYDLDVHPDVALPAIEEILRSAEFDVQIENTRIHARYDKERATDLHDLSEAIQRLFGLVPSLMDVDWIIGDLDLNEEARRAVAAAWAAFFREWGVLPMRHALTADRRGILTGVAHEPAGDSELRWSGSLPYRDCFTVDPPAGFWTALVDALRTRGLEHLARFEGERPVTERSLDTHLFNPLRLAAGRGEIAEVDGNYALAAAGLYLHCHEALVLAEILASDDASIARSARLARLVGLLEGRLRFRLAGSVNGYEVQSATMPLTEGAIQLYALRDGAGIPRIAVFATGGVLHGRRSDPDADWVFNWSDDSDTLSAILRCNNFPDPWMDPDPQPLAAIARTLRAVFKTPAPRSRTTPPAGTRVLGGVKASPGRVAGLARLGLAARRPTDLEGAILIASALSPLDNPFVFRSAAVISTGGGILSHVGLIALQFHKPSLIVEGAWQRSPTGVDSLAYCCPSTEVAAQRTVGPYEVVELREVPEREERIADGDLLVVDADEGRLYVLGQEPDALALHNELRQLVVASRSLAAAATDPELLTERGRVIRAVHQLERLFARLRDPVLACHAATELFTGDAASESAVGQTDKVKLLQVLLSNAAVNSSVRDTVEQLCGRLAARFASLRAEALGLVPTTSNPVEILWSRREVRRSRQLVDTVAELLRACGIASVPKSVSIEDIDSEAMTRLGNLRTRTLAAARHASGRGDWVRLRHLLRQLEQLDDVLGISEREREGVDSMNASLRLHDASAARGFGSRRVLGPADAGMETWHLTGAKAAYLADAGRAGEDRLIPPWFVVTDTAFRDVLDSALAGGETLRTVIAGIMARADLPDAEKSLAIARAWDTARLPGSLVNDLAAEYERLSAVPWHSDAPPQDDDERRPFVAVRSSAREEDTEAVARAGEFETFLFVRGVEALCAHLTRAWSGLWTERAIHNRAILGVREEVGGGVLVQRMVWARASGVLHTINLAEGRFREMVINAGLGLGEGIVSGAVAADQIVVAKQQVLGSQPLRFRYVTNDKRERVVFDARVGSGTRRVETLYHQRLRPALEYVELCELASAAARLEWVFRRPLDIEFALEGTHLRLLQIRPVPAVHALWRERADESASIGRQS